MSEALTWRPVSQEQERFLSSPADEALFGGAAGGGKALSIYAKIPTPIGYRNMLDLHVGDEVFGMNGNIYQIVGTSKVMRNHRVFDVAFDDGTVIRSDADHRWYTFTLSERDAIHKRSPEHRENRRLNRKKRGTGKRPDLAAVNKQRTENYISEPVSGGVRTTLEIKETLTVRGRVNHAVPVASPLQLPDRDLLIHPYMLGYWLGDGNSAYGRLTIGHMDSENALSLFDAIGYILNKQPSGKYEYNVIGLKSKLRSLGLLKNKHIPNEYLFSSFDQRLALLQGLMDTDGYVSESGQCEFYNSNPRLMQDVSRLLHTLGIKHAIREKKAPKGTVYNPSYRIKFVAPFLVFRLTRKAARQNTDLRATQNYRYIVDVKEVGTEPVKCIAINSPDHLYLAGEECVPTHNTDCLVMEALRQIGNKNYNGILFRRTFPELRLADGIEARTLNWYPGYGGRYNASNHVWTFPSGAKVFLGHLQRENDVAIYQSSQFGYIGFDELTHFSLYQYTYMFSRNRAPLGSGVRCYVRGGTNPGGVGHKWVKKRFVNAGIINKIGWFAKVNDIDTPVSRDYPYAKSRTFIPALLSSNPMLGTDYVANLRMLDPVTQKQLELGDWEAENRDDLIYPDFSDEFNVDVDAEYDPNYPLFWSMDDGYTNPRAILLIQVRPYKGKPDRAVVFREYYKSHQLSSQSIDEVIGWGYPLPELLYYDPAAAEFGATAVSMGLSTWGGYNNIAEGIKVVRRFILDGNGERRLVISPRCENLIDGMLSYKKNLDSKQEQGGDPIPLKDGSEHAPDGLRYFLATRFLHE